MSTSLASLDIHMLPDFLEGDYRIHTETPQLEQRVYYDTFDWRLYKQEAGLYRVEDEYVLRELGAQGETARARTESSVRFAHELPSGRLHSWLSPISKIRALLPLAKVDVNVIEFRVLNEDEKTVAKLTRADLPDDDISLLSLQPVRGYDKVEKRLTKVLEQLSEFMDSAAGLEAELYQHALNRSDRTPGAYSSKVDIILSPGMRSDEAAKCILRQLLTIIRANMEGVREDIDTEFLHDYRVAIRRTRSALSQIKNVFPTDVTDHYKKAFHELGKSTNALRDLDVYLLVEAEYRAMLPDFLQDDIAPLFEHLRKRRVQALSDTIETLNATETEQVLDDWEEFLKEPAPTAGSAGSGAANAAVPILVLSQQRIYGRYAHILKRGRRLLNEADLNDSIDERMHALRIDCKKLRYLMEFFSSLYPEDQIATLVQQLKYLQDNLGEFNDLAVQQRYLLRVAQELPLKNLQTGAALVAIGALVDALARRQDEVNAEFSDRFMSFSSEENQRLFQELFTVAGSYTDDA